MLYSLRIIILLYIYTYICKNLGCKKMDNLSELWLAVLKELETSLPQVVIETWISPLEPISFNGQEFILKTVNSFKKEIITNKFLDNIKNAVEKTLSFPVDIVIKTEEENIISASASAAESSKGLELTFEKFIVAPNNEHYFSCDGAKYKKNEWFAADKLEQCEISNLPAVTCSDHYYNNKDWIYFIESVTSVGPMDPKRMR